MNLRHAARLRDEHVEEADAEHGVNNGAWGAARDYFDAFVVSIYDHPNMTPDDVRNAWLRECHRYPSGTQPAK